MVILREKKELCGYDRNFSPADGKGVYTATMETKESALSSVLTEQRKKEKTLIARRTSLLSNGTNTGAGVPAYRRLIFDLTKVNALFSLILLMLEVLIGVTECARRTHSVHGMEWNEGLIFLYLLALSVLSLPLHLLNYSFPFHFVFELRIDAAGCVFPVLSETLLFGCLVGRSQSIFAISVGAIHSVPAFIHSRTAHMTRRLKWRILPFVRMMLIFLLF